MLKSVTGMIKLFMPERKERPFFAIIKHKTIKNSEKNAFKTAFSGKTLPAPANIEDVKMRLTRTVKNEKILDEEIFLVNFSPKEKKRYMTPQNKKKAKRMKRYEMLPKREKNTAISLPDAKPDPITVPTTIMTAEKVFFMKINIFIYFLKNYAT